MSRLFLVNLLLAFAWMYWQDLFSVANAFIGFGLGYLLLAFLCMSFRKSRYHIRMLRSVWLFFFFHYELLTSSIKVLWDIITPKQSSKPGFLAMPLDASTPLEIFFTANLISLTPGTLSIALAEDYKTLYIHAMFIDDEVEDSIAALKKFESVVLGAFR